MGTVTVKINSIPRNLEELQNSADFNPHDPAIVATMAIAALDRLKDNEADFYEMFGLLKGTASIYEQDKQMIKDKITKDDSYIPGLYFSGFNSSDGYNPNKPYELVLNIESGDSEHITYNIKSNINDNIIQIKLRYELSNNNWYLSSI